MKKIIYLFFGLILLTSCSENYVRLGDLERQDGGIITFNGEKFDGYAVSIWSSKNVIREIYTIKNGIPIKSEEYEKKKGKFEEIELNNGSKTYVSDILIYSKECDFEIYYYPDGSIKRKTQLSCKDGNLFYSERNGKSQEFDEQGNLIKVTYYKSGKKLKKTDE